MRKNKQTIAAYARRLQQRVPGRALLLGVAVAIVGVAALRYSLAEQTAPEPPQPPVGTTSTATKTARQIVVKYKPGVAESAARGSIANAEAVEKDEIEQLDMRILDVPAEKRQQTLDKLNQDPRVEYAVPDVPQQGGATTPNDPEYSAQWVWLKTQTDALWDKNKGDDLTVAVVDSGVNGNHPDLAGKALPGGYDFINEDDDPADDHGHGTAVAGVIAANSNNAAGVAGACWGCRILPVKALDQENKGAGSLTTQGIIYAADHGAQIINVSIYGKTDFQPLADAVKYAADKGIVVVACAGNENSDVPQYPAAYQEAISVAATTPDDTLASYSTFGPSVDIAGPGEARVLDFDSDGYATMNGTSFASPTVAGIIATLWSAFPDATAAQLREAVTSTADTCCDNKISGGRVNAIKAYNQLEAIDLVKPAVEITAPTQGATVTGNFQINATAADASGIAGVELRKDGNSLATDTEAPYSFAQDTLQLPEGANTITVRATDTAGNFTDAELSFTVQNDTTPPPTTPPPTTPPPGGNPKPADINADGTVNLTDLSILLSNWNKTTPDADLNSSGKVDLTDLSMLLSKWGTAG